VTEHASALVDDLLRPASLARDVERGLLGHILGRLEWPEQRYPMLAAWTEQWSRPAGEQHDALPLVHARHPQPVNTTTRVEVHPVVMRRAEPRPVPVVQAERRRHSEPIRAATPTRDEPTITHPVSAAPPPRVEPATRTSPRVREPTSTRSAELPRVVSAFRRDSPTLPGATPRLAAPRPDLSPGTAEPTLTHPAPALSPRTDGPAARHDLSPRTGTASSLDLSPRTGNANSHDLSPGPGDPVLHPARPTRTSLAPHPLAAALRPDTITIDPPLVHATPAPAASTRATDSRPDHDAPRGDAPRGDVPALVSGQPRIAATHSAPPSDPELVHTHATGIAAPAAHDDPITPHAAPLPHPSATPRVAPRRAVTARAPQPTPTIAARWIADDDAPPLQRPRAAARPAQVDLPHVVTPAPSTPQPARRPVPEAIPVATAARPNNTTTTPTTTTAPQPALDLDAVVDTTMRRLGRELERARGLRKALR